MLRKSIASLLLLGSTMALAAPNYDRAQAVSTTPQPGQILPRPNGVNLINNPGFETNGGAGTNSFTGWTVVDQAGGSGSWSVQTGTASPLNAFAVPAPTEATFAAMTDQTGPGSHVLYQDVAVPASGGTLSFDLFINNQAADFSVPNPASLDYTVNPNQQFRADVMSTTAADFDVGAGVLANVYQTIPGDPLVSGYSTVTFDMAPFAGQTVRLRFAEVDNQNFFNTGVDNVSLVAAPAAAPVTAVPALGIWSGLLLLAGLLTTFWWVRRG